MIQRKRILAQYGDEPAIEVAVFAFDGERVLARYLDRRAEQLFVEGIVGPGRLLTPADGREFFEGLDRAFHRSSTLHVVTD